MNNRKLKFNESGFWPSWLAKLLFTLISVKVWGLALGTGVSTWLLIIHLKTVPVVVAGQVVEYGINGAQWVTFNTTLWALIFGMKEIYRISEQRDYAEQQNLSEKLKNKLEVAGILTDCGNTGKDKQENTSDTGIVGDEPLNEEKP